MSELGAGHCSFVSSAAVRLANASAPVRDVQNRHQEVNSRPRSFGRRGRRLDESPGEEGKMRNVKQAVSVSRGANRSATAEGTICAA